MLASNNKQGTYVFDCEPFEMTADHKPFKIKEKQRIEKMNGEIKQNLNRNGEPSGVYRVWLKN